TEPYLRAALRLDPENSVALAAMAEYQYRSGHYLDARAFSQRRLDAAAATPDVLLLASQIEEKMGDRAAAERYRQRLGREFPHASQQTPGG
ncbi:MAG: type IV pilus biogenesis/stability protein PilW, partial [Luteimonas sp.]